jgi:hypothetical protein
MSIEREMRHIERYRMLHGIEGDKKSDLQVAILFLDGMRHGDIRDFDKFMYDYYNKKENL